MRTRPKHPRLGRWGRRFTRGAACAWGRIKGLHAPDSPVARETLALARTKLERGEIIHVLGIGGAGHNAGVGLVSASARDGIRLRFNHEEERFRGEKHYKHFPSRAIEESRSDLEALGIGFGDIDAIVTTWDYPRLLGEAAGLVLDEGPAALRLLFPNASPAINLADVWSAFGIPRKLGDSWSLREPVPVLCQRHHDNHAWFSHGVSPFADSPDPVMVAVIDGMGDDASVSLYLAQDGRLNLQVRNRSVVDSLGMMYLFISSTQGGWPPLSSEGRFMGAAAWGDGNRESNPHYASLRQLFAFAEEGEVFLNRDLANWHRAGSLAPYTPALKEILGEPIPLDRMWHPDAVLDVDAIQHDSLGRERADKAAATQLVFEDALHHIVKHFVRKTGASRLVLTGGTALNCLANLTLMERFNSDWFRENGIPSDGGLQLWVPPIPGDAGVPMGAAYHFCCRAGALSEAGKGERLTHAFWCGRAPSGSEILQTVENDAEVGFRPIAIEQLPALMAFLVARGCVIGWFQGRAETGPRALGHRSILADPRRADGLDLINRSVKFREPFRPLAPMMTRSASEEWFEIPSNVRAADGNALNYMVLAVRAKPETRKRLPAVVHRDGSSRIQIVRREADPLTHGFLEAMGREAGVEVAINTSLNVGSPIVQDPSQAINAMKRSRGLDALFLAGSDGAAFAAWHLVEGGRKDGGKRFLAGLDAWQTPRVIDSRVP